MAHQTPSPSDTRPVPLEGLPGIGLQSAQWLQAAGIHDAAQLRALGSVAAYLAVRRSEPSVSLNLLWALEGALTGRAWQTVARQDRTRLLLALDAAAEQQPN